MATECCWVCPCETLSNPGKATQSSVGSVGARSSFTARLVPALRSRSEQQRLQRRNPPNCHRMAWRRRREARGRRGQRRDCVVPAPQMHGVLRVVMEPLLGDVPLVGALSVFFLKKPVSPT